MNPPTNGITDMQRCDFLWALNKSDLAVTDWEVRFIASFISSGQPSSWFTLPRREAVDLMRRKYGREPEIGMPLNESGPTEGTAGADPNGCEYYVRPEGRQARCNEPAVWMRQTGFRYCERHAEEVQRALKRRGHTMHLIPFTKCSARISQKDMPA